MPKDLFKKFNVVVPKFYCFPKLKKLENEVENLQITCLGSII